MIKAGQMVLLFIKNGIARPHEEDVPLSGLQSIWVFIMLQSAVQWGGGSKRENKLKSRIARPDPKPFFDI